MVGADIVAHHRACLMPIQRPQITVQICIGMADTLMLFHVFRPAWQQKNLDPQPGLFDALMEEPLGRAVAHPLFRGKEQPPDKLFPIRLIDPVGDADHGALIAGDKANDPY